MKKNILLIAGSVLAFTAVSCSLEENTEPVVDSVVPMEFTADATATRTAITEDNAVIWNEESQKLDNKIAREIVVFKSFDTLKKKFPSPGPKQCLPFREWNGRRFHDRRALSPCRGDQTQDQKSNPKLTAQELCSSVSDLAKRYAKSRRRCRKRTPAPSDQ